MSVAEFWRDVLGGWGPALVVVLLGVVAGWLLRSVVHGRLVRLAARTRGRADDQIVRAAAGFWFPAATLFSLLPAARLSPLAGDHRLVVERFALAGLLIALTLAVARVMDRRRASGQRVRLPDDEWILLNSSGEVSVLRSFQTMATWPPRRRMRLNSRAAAALSNQ